MISELISRDFVRLWEPKYDTGKYPVDFYLRHSASARNAKKPEHLKDDLLALLHWKDGKALAFVPGEIHAKQNILNPVLSLTGAALADVARSFRGLVQADGNNFTECMENLRNKLGVMWSTVVIPAFLLHVARPDRLPIIDQHSVRAFLALTGRQVIEHPDITWDLWRVYGEFFQDAVAAAGFGHGPKERCYVDRALFAYGKSLKKSPKDTTRLKHDSMVAKPVGSPVSKVGRAKNSPVLWGQPVPNKGIIPSSCNVLKALREYLDIASLDSLPQWKKQNLRDLKFHRFDQSRLRELLQDPGGKVSGQVLQSYKKEMGGGSDIRQLPRPILCAFLVGWASICGIRGRTATAAYLHNSGFGGTRNAAMAAVTVGQTTGGVFGLLDDSGSPTALFHEYFGV